MAKEMPKTYEPQEAEDRIYNNWMEKGYFHTEIDRSKKPYTIVMPPPNITGQLHMGHQQGRTRQREIPRAGLGLETRIRRKNRQAAQKDGLLLRLGTRALHHGRRMLQGGYRGIQQDV